MRQSLKKNSLSPAPEPKADVKTARSQKAAPDNTGRVDARMVESSKAKLPHERDESISETGKKPSKRIQQAHQDVSRGLQDTDRGPVADRAYKKLKQ